MIRTGVFNALSLLPTFLEYYLDQEYSDKTHYHHSVSMDQALFGIHSFQQDC